MLRAALLALLAAGAARALTDPPLFEAAFQGRCGEGSPCEQLCRQLHDGTYECGCGMGYELHVNGYSCMELNSTKPPELSDMEEDVLYEKDASFTAELEIASPSNMNRIRKTTKHIDHRLTTSIPRREKHTSYPNPVSSHPNNETTHPNHVSSHLIHDSSHPYHDSSHPNYMYTGEREKEDDGMKQLIEDGIRDAELIMISEGKDELKVTTQGPSLEQKVPGGTFAPPGTAAVETATCKEAKCHSTTARRVSTPRFSGRSWMAVRALRGAYKRVRVRLRVRPERARGVLLLTGEHDDLSGDYLALLVRAGHVELRFDCGSGAGILRSPEPVKLGHWNTISVYRHRWDAWLKLNNGKRVKGRSKGLFSRMTFREPVWVGGAGNTTGLTNKLGLTDGFVGCVDYLKINADTYRLVDDAVATLDVGECAPTLSPWRPLDELTSEIPNPHTNEILHFGDNDIVMRDATKHDKPKKKHDNSIEQFKNKNIKKTIENGSEIQAHNENRPNKLDDKGASYLKTNDLSAMQMDEKYQNDCDCQHGGGCVNGGCLCPLGYAGVKCEITLDLKVPRFNGSSYLRLPGLGSTARSWLDIQITLKPSSGDGLILYNADNPNGAGDFISLQLRDYYVEFAFDLGSGITLVRSSQPLTRNTWHRVTVNRWGRRCTLRVTSDIRCVTSVGTHRYLSLNQPLYLGGAPQPMSPRLATNASFSGCISQLIINDEELQIVSSALAGVNVHNCDSRDACSERTCTEEVSDPILPQIIPHNITPKKGFKHSSKHNKDSKKKTYRSLKMKKHENFFVNNKHKQMSEHENLFVKKEQKQMSEPEILFVKNEQKQMSEHENLFMKKEQKQMSEHENLFEKNEQKQMTEQPYDYWGDNYPSFSGKDSYIHIDDEETMKRLLSYTLDINIRFRSVSPHGLLVWSGKAPLSPAGDFLSLAIENSVLVFRYDLGSGEVVIIANHTKVDDGLWHRARATRNRQAGVLEVDGLGSVGKISPGGLKQLNTNTGLYIGGLPAIEVTTAGRHRSGLIGCVKKISLSGDFDIPLSLSKLPHTITNNVGRCLPQNWPTRSNGENNDI